jgi:hypothetical protein
MNPESEDFESLRRLLALKRHEQPPPGYFNNFSREVNARLRAGGDKAGAGAWMQWLWGVLEAKPILAGAFGAGVCAVLISGILNSEGTGIASGTSLNPVASQNAAPFVSSMPAVALNEPGASQTLLTADPATPPLSSLFDFHLSAQPVSAEVVLPGNQ